MSSSLTDYLGLINTFLIICTAIGGYFAVRNARKEAIIKVQDDTIKALNQRIDSLATKIDDLTLENYNQRNILETIQAALKQKGIMITIDGDLVTITDIKGTSSSLRKKTVPSPPTARSPKDKQE